MPQHLREAVLDDEGHDPVYAGHFYAKKLMQKLSLVYHWPGIRGDVIPEVCFLCNLCIYTRPGKEIQATSSQHSSPWTISLYRNGLQGDGFEQTGQLLCPSISRLSDQVARSLCSGRQEGNYSSYGTNHPQLKWHTRVTSV